MSYRINLFKGDGVFIEEREHEFFNFVPSESGAGAPDELQFMDKRDHRIRVLSREEFESLYLSGNLRWKSSIVRKGDEVPEEHCEDGTLRTIRQAFTKSYDENPVPKTNRPLEERYAEVLQSLKLSAHEWGRKGGTLRRWINQRGESGHRPRKCMGDRRRRGPSALRKDPIVLNLLAAKAELYWADRNATAKDIYVAVRTALKDINADRKSKQLKLLPVPGRTSVWRYLTTHTDYDNTRRRHGARTADRLFKPLIGSLDVKRILDVAIMDHTWADCHVIDDVHNLPCGRPYITILIDVRSRHILAYVIGFTPPSVETAMACLRRAVRPKHDLIASFPDVRGELPFGVPRTVLVDNGWEFSGGSFKDACEDAGITVHWAPVRTPEYKGICERFFRTLNQIVLHKIKGSVPLPVHRLREYGLDPAADAVILLSELEEILLQAIVEVYGREFHTGIKAVPEEVWRTRAAIDGIDYAPDLRALDFSLSKLGGERILTRAGIEFQGLTFRSEAVHSLLNDMLPCAPKRGTRRGTVGIKFKFWPEDLSKVAVWNTVSQSYVQLPCTDETYAKGLSEHHHGLIAAYARDQGLEFSSEDDRCAARARLNEKIASFVTSRTIGDRRRAQRVVAARERISTEIGGRLPTLINGDNVIPIETVSNRRTGDQPARNAVRKRHKQSTTKRKSPQPQTQPANRAGPVSAADPFAAFNRDELLQR